MRIAILGSEGVPYPNAFAKISEEIGCRLVERGHEVLVYGRRRFVPDATPYRGMMRVPIPSWNSKHLDTITFTFLSTLHLLRSGWADIAHYHGIGPSLLAVLPPLRGMKSVVHVHALDWQRAKWGLFARRYLRLSEATAVRVPQATVAVSLGLKAYLEGRYGRTVYYVPQGLDRPVRRQPKVLGTLSLRPGRYLLYMGRLVPEKGLHYLLEAYRRLANGSAGPEPPPLVVAGGAAHSDDYVRRVQDSAPPGVHFLGHVEGRLKEELLSQAYLYIQPSEMEGLSLALLEAMSYGNAVLVSDIPENLEAVAEHGVTFRSRDVDDLAERLATLLRDPAGVRLLGQHAREHVLSRYSWDRVAEEMEAVYHHVLTRTGEVVAVGPEGRPAQ